MASEFNTFLHRGRREEREEDKKERGYSNDRDRSPRRETDRETDRERDRERDIPLSPIPPSIDTTFTFGIEFEPGNIHRSGDFLYKNNNKFYESPSNKLFITLENTIEHSVYSKTYNKIKEKLHKEGKEFQQHMYQLYPLCPQNI
jgi:hypothetical protein